MRRTLSLVLVVAAISAIACSKGTSVPAGSEGTVAPTSSPTNTTSFPLYQNSSVIDSRQFSKTITSGETSTGAMSAGAGTYSGNEVIAASGATLADLENWLRQQEKQPPSGMVVVAIPASMASVHTIAVKNGMDFAIFHDANNAKHGLVVIALDPATAHQKLGPALMAVSKYGSLPAPVRQGIDAQLKQRYGYTASEFVEPGSPLGAAVGAMNDFQNKNQRAIIIIDATKQ
jgi:hypothetical protein